MASLRDFDAAVFLRDSWQKRPQLIRDAFTAWSNPLEPDELAGLACEPELESRLVRQTGPQTWELEPGPLQPERFGELGASPWTLLVQAVDHHVREVAALKAPFRFLPDWRFDDVMVSYATDGGGVGPHFDQYDVFLIQGLGRRRWRIGQSCDETTPLLPHDGLRLLADFECAEEWVLEPGDILYVPPGIAHEGVAIGDDCMTYSVGFRAPSRGDLVSAWADHVLDTLSEDDRYTDPNLQPDARPGEISDAALARLQAMALGALADKAAFAAWFGRYITEPKNDQLDWAPEKMVTAQDWARSDGTILFDRNPAIRCSFIRSDAEAVTLFVDGASYACRGGTAPLAERLCVDLSLLVEPDELAEPDVADLLADLVNRGVLAPRDDG